MAVPMSPTRRRPLQRPAPHFCPNVDLSNHIYKGPLSWSEWKRLRGGGVSSWLAWLRDAVTMVPPTQAELNLLTHEGLLYARVCHTWDKMTWCFCEEAA